ncbi:hypothetical protein [Ancylobacter mangrovi]|uniref:hypothetical protein n=1 Tax=Ancylobacter mangrovi TaxID=2972472 RepID=UPI0021615152|nr:hypothetical protein [Ancylobacter mangrovi]MCS0502535.1 hypothetical protein [Ancylobacter mangrovi]
MSSPDSSRRTARPSTLGLSTFGSSTHPAPVRRALGSRLLGIAGAGLLALSTAGCFQPMYAQKPDEQGPSMQQQLSDIEIVFSAGRIGNEVRNDLIFALTGGAGNPSGTPYRLEMRATDNTTAAIVDSVSGLPEVELVSVQALWRLVDNTDPKKPVTLTSNMAFGKASVDSGYQRFARERAIRDAQNRASQVVADTIKMQLASYFATKRANGGKEPGSQAAGAPASGIPATGGQTLGTGTPVGGAPKS